MNIQAHPEELVQLRALAYQWLQNLRDSAGLSIDPQSNYPFPEHFPFTLTPTQGSLWLNLTRPPYIPWEFDVHLQLRTTRPNTWGPTVPVEFLEQRVWTITTDNGETELGYFELEARIYLQPAFVVGPDLILQGLLASLREGQRTALWSRVFPDPSPAANRNIEVFELGTLDGNLVHDYGRRAVQPRNCDTCGCCIPPSGPPLCLAHLYAL